MTNDFYAFIMGIWIIVFGRERLFMLFLYVRFLMLFIREIVFIVLPKDRLFMFFQFTCTVYKSEIN